MIFVIPTILDLSWLVSSHIIPNIGAPQQGLIINRQAYYDYQPTITYQELSGFPNHQYPQNIDG